MTPVLVYPAMFFACLALDFVYAKWIMSVNENKELKAAVYSALCVLVGQATTLFCVHDWWLILPACLGHAAGTVIAMRTLGDGKIDENPRPHGEVR